MAETIWVRFSAGGAADAEVAALPVVAPVLLSVPAALMSAPVLLSVPAALLSVPVLLSVPAALRSLALLLAGELVWGVDGCLLSDFISLAAFEPFGSPLSWALAPLFEGGAVSAVDPFAGELLSVLAGALLSLFAGAALSDFCGGA